MDKEELESMLISHFPAFQAHWKREDIDREDDGSFTAHGIMSSFEEVVASDPNDKSEAANAICTSFLELIAGDVEGKRLEPYLGKACKEFYSNWL